MVSKQFIESIFADDLNSYKNFHKTIGDEYIKKELKDCQDVVHAWGRANRVQFDPGKEHFYILDARSTIPEDFEILGATFDTKLKMNKEIFKLSCEVSRKMRALLRVRKFYNIAALIRLYKAHVLPYAER